MTVKRFDIGNIRGDASRTETGYIRAEAIVTRSGVFYYRNPDGTIRRELRHPDDVFSAPSLASMRMIPVTNGHPPELFVDVRNAKELSIGHVGENIQPDGKYVVAPLLITARDGVDAVEAGRKELSLGYELDLVEEGGVYDGQPYDFRQTNIRYNHLAIVDEARAGHEARLNLDAADAVEIQPPEKTEIHNDEKQGATMPKVTIDGIDYEAAPEVINAHRRAVDERDRLQNRLDKQKTIALDGVQHRADAEVLSAVDKITAERDELKQRLDSVEKQASPEAIQTAVKTRVKVLDAGKRVLDGETVKTLDTQDNPTIMKAVIVECAPQERRDGLKETLEKASEDYLQARFDAAVELMPAGKTSIDEQRARVIPRNDGEHVEPVEKARQDMIDRQTKKRKED